MLMGMKKAATVIAALLLCIFTVAAPVSALADDASPARYAYLPAAAVLYNDAGDAVCSLPATYFVALCGENAGGSYPVAYLDLRGYVRKEQLECVDYEPVTKFATLSARPQNDGMAINLREKPDASTGAVVKTVPPSAVLTLYGARSGTELFAGAGNLWQYVRYDEGAQSYYGYAYSAQLLCDVAPPNKIEKVVQPAVAQPTEEPSDVTLTRTGSIVFIAALCVPAGILMIVLFYRPESKRTPRHK